MLVLYAIKVLDFKSAYVRLRLNRQHSVIYQFATADIFKSKTFPDNVYFPFILMLIQYFYIFHKFTGWLLACVSLFSVANLGDFSIKTQIWGFLAFGELEDF
jgi:hypothetical protein